MMVMFDSLFVFCVSFNIHTLQSSTRIIITTSCIIIVVVLRI